MRAVRDVLATAAGWAVIAVACTALAACAGVVAMWVGSLL